MTEMKAGMMGRGVALNLKGKLMLLASQEQWQQLARKHDSVFKRRDLPVNEG